MKKGVSFNEIESPPSAPSVTVNSAVRFSMSTFSKRSVVSKPNWPSTKSSSVVATRM